MHHGQAFGWDSVLIATLLLGLVIFSVLWLIHGPRRDAGIVDWWWAGGFAATAWLEWVASGRAGGLQLFVTVAVTIWAVRLTVHLVVRHRRRGGIEDPRYAAMRARGGPNWPRTNLVTVFWLQAVVQWALAAPIHAALLHPEPGPLSPAALWLASAGCALFVIGFVIEWVADAQLSADKADPARRSRLVTTGLWAWSRHPNYFGEAVLWWGLGLVGAAASGLWWVLVATAALTVLLLKVSGIPPLEAVLATRPGWPDYAARTSAFLPRPPRPVRPG